MSNPDQLGSNTPFAGSTWLGYASSKGELAAMKLLIELGADINQGDHREAVKPICNAAAANKPEAVSYLLEMGSSLDTQTSVRNPLFSAVVGRSPASVSLLLAKGMDSSVRYSTSTMRGMDALAFAIMRGEPECADLIAEHQASGNRLRVSGLLAEANRVAHENAFSRS